MRRARGHGVTSQFSVLLRQLRRQTAMTQEDLAESAGVSVRTIRRLETGESANPQIETVRLLADALKLRPDERAQMLAAVDGQPQTPNGQPGSSFLTRLNEAVDDLAHAVAARWGREEELRRIQDPFPLPVRWRMAPEELTDHWENICRAEPGETVPALDLAGRLERIVDTYRRIPSGRLVVLGKAGSGKTILAVRFVLDLLKTRPDRVPVPVGLGSWDPTSTGFRDWLTRQLVRDYPGLAAPGRDGSTLAAALIEAEHILPVLDGFDELAKGLHGAALDALGATTLPLLLTSRPTEYKAAVAGSDVLTAAAAVELTDLGVPELVNYLPRTTRKAAGSGTVWDPVLAEVREHPESPAGVNLRTPLMVGLARAIYSDSPGSDPKELLDFDTPQAVEDHLLGSFIPTVYRQRPGERWGPERARHWLGYLARHLSRLGTHDLAWWQLGNSMRRGQRMLIVGLVSGFAVGLVSGLVIWLVDWPAVGFGRALVDGIVSALGNWLGFGLALGLAHGAGLTLGSGGFEPSRVRLRTRGRTSRLRGRFWPRLMVGLAGGIGLGLVLGLTGLLGLNPLGLVGFDFLGRLATGAGLGALSGLVWGLTAGLEAPLDLTSAVSPVDLLKTNRLTVAVQFLVWGLALGLTHWVVVEVVPGRAQLSGFVLAVVLGPVTGLAIGTSLTAWGQWLVFARVWLPLTGRLPWAVIDFLDDAGRRGVLRQAGAVYQFRHARLRDHLSAHRTSTAGR